MKLLQSTIVAAVTGFFVGMGSLAQAIVYDTYVFTGTTDHSLDGSTITIEGSVSGHSIYSWDLMDANGDIVFTPDNSFVNDADITSYTATTWTGGFAIYGEGGYAGDNFDGNNSAGGGDLSYTGDPGGIWTAVPDATNGFQLCALAIGAVGAFHFYLRRRTPALPRD